MAINHPAVKKIYFMWEGTWEVYHEVLVIETDLQLNPEHPSFDFEPINALIAEANRYVQDSNPEIDRFRLVSVVENQVE